MLRCKVLHADTTLRAESARDAAAARAVHEQVGPDMDLMVDSHHWSSQTEALELERALEELHYT